MTACPSSFLRRSAAIALIACSAGAQAAALVSNGSFESGFAGWTRVDQLGSDGTFSVQTGNASPFNGIRVPLPTDGAFAAMTGSGGPQIAVKGVQGCGRCARDVVEAVVGVLAIHLAPAADGLHVGLPR